MNQLPATHRKMFDCKTCPLFSSLKLEDLPPSAWREILVEDVRKALGQS